MKRKLTALAMLLSMEVAHAATTCYYYGNTFSGGSPPDYQSVPYASNTFSSGDNLCAHPNAYTSIGNQFEKEGTNPTGGWGQLAAWIDNNHGLNHEPLRNFTVIEPFPTYSIVGGQGQCSAVTYQHTLNGTTTTKTATGVSVLETTTSFADCEDPISNPAKNPPQEKCHWYSIHCH